MLGECWENCDYLTWVIDQWGLGFVLGCCWCLFGDGGQCAIDGVERMYAGLVVNYKMFAGRSVGMFCNLCAALALGVRVDYGLRLVDFENFFIFVKIFD